MEPSPHRLLALAPPPDTSSSARRPHQIEPCELLGLPGAVRCSPRPPSTTPATSHPPTHPPTSRVVADVLSSRGREERSMRRKGGAKSRSHSPLDPAEVQWSPAPSMLSLLSHLYRGGAQHGCPMDARFVGVQEPPNPIQFNIEDLQVQGYMQLKKLTPVQRRVSSSGTARGSPSLQIPVDSQVVDSQIPVDSQVQYSQIRLGTRKRKRSTKVLES